ncbi:MAG TPA: response regulator [Rudaea sp.]|jgi:CheY-like chemotaxis protein/HPt (histidine-containing phosphotransfer) domain-containing protein
MPDTNLTPRVLIVDDDRVSLRFLEAAAMQSGCVVATAVDGAAALAAHGDFDLLLIDRGLPDVDGVELLCALRERGIAAPAIATSAEIDAATANELYAAGFADVLEKPVSVRRVIEIVAQHLPKTTPILLDDIAALDSIGGDTNALRALRGLLAQELEELERDLTHGDLAACPARLDERLHRLRASCGFCGASALAAHAAQLQSTLGAETCCTDAQRDAFVAACRETAVALRG